MTGKWIEANNVTKTFESPEGEIITALSEVDLEVEDNQFTTLLGPSGCGKSTLLNLVAGFLEPDEGTVEVAGEEVEGPSSDRAVVFQESESLFEWKTCLQNVKFGPLATGSTEEEAEDIAKDMLELVGLVGFEDHYPNQLSGGMQQRLNLARALANEPRIMLMDEPFGALDAQTKTILQEALLQIWSGLDQTIVFVTHDVEEAVFLSDQIVVMTAGPGEIKSTYEVDFEYPREFGIRERDDFIEIKNEILEELHEESVEASQQILETD